jgi:hypothetical protein
MRRYLEPSKQSGSSSNWFRRLRILHFIPAVKNEGDTFPRSGCRHSYRPRGRPSALKKRSCPPLDQVSIFQAMAHAMKALFIICGAFLLFAADIASNDGDGLRELVSFIRTI